MALFNRPATLVDQIFARHGTVPTSAPQRDYSNLRASDIDVQEVAEEIVEWLKSAELGSALYDTHYINGKGARKKKFLGHSVNMILSKKAYGSRFTKSNLKVHVSVGGNLYAANDPKAKIELSVTFRNHGSAIMNDTLADFDATQIADLLELLNKRSNDFKKSYYVDMYT